MIVPQKSAQPIAASHWLVVIRFVDPTDDFLWPCEQSILRRLGQSAVGRDLAALAIRRICEQRTVGTMRGWCRAERQSPLRSVLYGLAGSQFGQASTVLRLRTAVVDSAWLSR